MMKAKILMLLCLTKFPVLFAQNTQQPAIRNECELHFAAINQETQQVIRPYQTFYNEKHYDKAGHTLREMSFSHIGCFENESYERYIYNDKGQWVQTIRLNEEGVDTKESWRYIYDPQGRVIQVKHTDSRGSFKDRKEIKYNEQGLKVEELTYLPLAELSERVVYRYNVAGKLVEYQRYNANNALTYRKVYVYDSVGRCVEEQDYYDEKPNSYKRQVYDNAGKLREKYQGSSPDDASRYVYSYDSLGRDVGLKIYGRDKKLSIREQLHYDDKGKLQKHRIQHFGRFFKRIELIFYSYNEQGDPIEELKFYSLDNKGAEKIEAVGSIPELLSTDGFGEYILLRYSYEYNTAGQATLIIQDEYRNGDTLPRFSGIKTIEYYD